jgi:hypothetical protein
LTAEALDLTLPPGWRANLIEERCIDESPLTVLSDEAMLIEVVGLRQAGNSGWQIPANLLAD